MNDKIVIYRTEDGQTSVNVRMDGDTVWLSQAQMAELFQKDRTVIGRHINNIYKEHELERETTCANFAHMGKDADQTYQDYLVKGYAVNKALTEQRYSELKQLVAVLDRTARSA